MNKLNTPPTPRLSGSISASTSTGSQFPSVVSDVTMADVTSSGRTSLTRETEPRRSAFGSKLFSLKNNHYDAVNTRPFGASGRTFNYEDKYEVDEWGTEMRQESRFYRTYVDESEMFDLDRIGAWRDALDVLLVIIGLFSAIVTTFVVQTSQALQPDYNQLTAVLVYNLIRAQESSSNTSTTAITTPIPHPNDLTASPSQNDIFVNALWFTSLTISLSTALVAVLTKQWLYRYMSPLSGTSQEQTRLRQFRYAGLEKYRVPMIIDLLPVALHVSLALFLAGLTLFLKPLHTGMAVGVGIVAGTVYVAYVASIVLPLFDPQCPYQSPISAYLFQLWGVIRIWTRNWYTFASQRCMATRKLIEKLLHRDLPMTMDGVESSSSLPLSLSAQERQAVWERRNQLDIDSITWLHSTISNTTVRRISFQAVVGLTPSNADTSRLIDVIRPYYDDRIRSCTDGYFVYDGREAEYHHTIQGACIEGFEVDLKYVHSKDVDLIESDGRRVFHKLVIPPQKHRGLKLEYQSSGITIREFLVPGPRSHVQLPLSVWRFCIMLLGKSKLDAIMLTRLLEHGVHQPTEGVEQDSPATFINAIQGNAHLYSLLLDVLASQLGVHRTDVMSLHSIPLIFAIQNWAWDRTSMNQDVLCLLTASFRAFLLNNLPNLPVGVKIQIRDLCSRFYVDSLSTTPEGWETYSAAAHVLSSMWDKHLHCPKELFFSLLRHLDCTPPEGTNPVDIVMTLKVIPSVVISALDPGMFYDMLREHDVLPTELASSGASSPFWGPEMSRIAVFAGVSQPQVDLTAEWTVRWLDYISTPERLSFIFQQTLVEDWDEHILLKRVVPLLDLTSGSANWGLCFYKLIELLDDEIYLTLIDFWHSDPRRRLSELLMHMQDFLLVDLSGCVVPRFDESGHTISSVSSISLGEENPIPEAINSWREERAATLKRMKEEDDEYAQRDPGSEWQSDTVFLPMRIWRVAAERFGNQVVASKVGKVEVKPGPSTRV